MFAKPTCSAALPKGSWERAVARIAHRANTNTIHGGISALRIADRALKLNLPHADVMADAVSATYSASTGHPSPDHRAWECGECGSVHLGRDAAEQCCSCDDDYADDNDLDA